MVRMTVSNVRASEIKSLVPHGHLNVPRASEMPRGHPNASRASELSTGSSATFRGLFGLLALLFESLLCFRPDSGDGPLAVVLACLVTSRPYQRHAGRISNAISLNQRLGDGDVDRWVHPTSNSTSNPTAARRRLKRVVVLTMAMVPSPVAGCCRGCRNCLLLHGVMVGHPHGRPVSHGGYVARSWRRPLARAGVLATAVVAERPMVHPLRLPFIGGCGSSTSIVRVIRIDRFNGRVSMQRRSSHREVPSPTAFTSRHRCPCGS
jgi:hypothetical protein